MPNSRTSASRSTRIAISPVRIRCSACSNAMEPSFTSISSDETGWRTATAADSQVLKKHRDPFGRHSGFRALRDEEVELPEKISLFPGAAQNLYLNARNSFTQEWRVYCEQQAKDAGVELLSLEQAATPADLGLRDVKRPTPEPEQSERDRRLEQAVADAANPRVPTPEVAAKLQSPEIQNSSQTPLLGLTISTVTALTASTGVSLATLVTAPTTSTTQSLLTAPLPNVLPTVNPQPLQSSTSLNLTPFVVPTTAPHYHTWQPAGGFGRGQTAPPLMGQPPFQSSSGSEGSRFESSSTGQYSQTSQLSINRRLATALWSSGPRPERNRKSRGPHVKSGAASRTHDRLAG